MLSQMILFISDTVSGVGRECGALTQMLSCSVWFRSHCWESFLTIGLHWKPYADGRAAMPVNCCAFRHTATEREPLGTDWAGSDYVAHLHVPACLGECSRFKVLVVWCGEFLLSYALGSTNSE